MTIIPSNGEIALPEALPKLLLISEVTLTTTANPTLFNLFKAYPPDRLLSIAPTSSMRAHPPQPPLDRLYLEFAEDVLPKPRRGYSFVRPLLEPANIYLRDMLPLPHAKRIFEFGPEVLVISPIGPPCLVMGQKLSRTLGVPTIAYFMDDWPATGARSWLGRKFWKRTRALLEQSDAWIMISEELRDVMAQRYRVPTKPTLVAHNPVDLSGQFASGARAQRTGRFRVLYAGSVQQMHYDALLAVTTAVWRLRSAGVDIELVLHTAPYFEQKYRADWDRLGVVLGGLVPYEKLPGVLGDADLLLVALSFMPEMAHMAMYSLLTKITDYMASGVPLLVCGPPGSASVNFVKRWACGLTCETDNVDQIKDLLKGQLDRPVRSAELAARAYHVLEQEFAVGPVQRRLYKFLAQVAARKQEA
jgi:glycosyltransferase involved in cell wall biosynthesis